MTSEEPIGDDEAKEIYALFGGAYYFSEVLHRGLCNFYSIAPFENRAAVTALIVEQRLAVAFKLTLGEVVSGLEPWTKPDLQEHLRNVVKRRNYLAHHFWFQRIALMRNRHGLEELARELREMRELFSSADDAISQLCVERYRTLGVPDGAIEAALADMEAGLEYPDHEQRRLAREETIVRVWDVPFGDGGLATIFELLDGTLWQLGDQGLSWTKRNVIESDWTENPVVKKYLPAKTKPLPGKAGSWDYEFTLKGARLWVKLDPSENRLRWGTRRRKANPRKL